MAECAGRDRLPCGIPDSRAGRTGTNGLNFVFCNTGRPTGSPFSPEHPRTCVIHFNSSCPASLLRASADFRSLRDAITQRPSALFRAYSSADR